MSLSSPPCAAAARCTAAGHEGREGKQAGMAGLVQMNPLSVCNHLLPGVAALRVGTAPCTHTSFHRQHRCVRCWTGREPFLPCPRCRVCAYPQSLCAFDNRSTAVVQSDWGYDVEEPLPTPPTAAWVRQPWSACLGFVTMMKYVAKTTVFIASNTLIGMRNLRARPSHGRRLPVQHYTACLGGTRSLWSARNFGCTREHARVSVVGGYRAAESGAGGTLGCSGSQTGESTTAAPAPVNAALSHRQRSDPTEQASNSAKERRVRAAHLGGWELHRL